MSQLTKIFAKLVKQSASIWLDDSFKTRFRDKIEHNNADAIKKAFDKGGVFTKAHRDYESFCRNNDSQWTQGFNQGKDEQTLFTESQRRESVFLKSIALNPDNDLSDIIDGYITIDNENRDVEQCKFAFQEASKNPLQNFKNMFVNVFDDLQSQTKKVLGGLALIFTDPKGTWNMISNLFINIFANVMNAFGFTQEGFGFKEYDSRFPSRNMQDERTFTEDQTYLTKLKENNESDYEQEIQQRQDAYQDAKQDEHADTSNLVDTIYKDANHVRSELLGSKDENGDVRKEGIFSEQNMNNFTQNLFNDPEKGTDNTANRSSHSSNSF
ncbi:MAG TPA: hypothetical protein QF353_01360 [Gammaproteobacteria bacterium]|nr:hypothetical protein [Gammaproteobacteria bacterium]